MAENPHNGEFSIIRHGLLDDDKFSEVYPDDALFAAWTRLLIAADKAYPAPAAIPYGTKPRSFERLVEVGLIVKTPNNHYLVKGMPAERALRSERFRKSALALWEKKRRDSDADATHGDADASERE